MKFLNLDQIKSVIPKINLIEVIEESFSEQSNNNVVNPPVGEMLFDNPPGDTHIKYGYLKNSQYYVIKIASGFYENHLHGLPTSHGLMLVFNKTTGKIESILLDEGYLTNLRTAVAGAIATKYCAPKDVKAIGIVGTGSQAHMQLDQLRYIISCKNVVVYGRRKLKLESYKNHFEKKGFNIKTTQSLHELANLSNLIITTTPSMSPLLDLNMLQPGTHITAIGSDTPEKNELNPNILQAADLIVTDSIQQSKFRGEIFQALKNKTMTEKANIIEIGEIISGKYHGRQNDQDITVADFTGIAAQDIKIAESVYEAFTKLKTKNSSNTIGNMLITKM